MSDLLQYVMPEWVADLGEDAQFITLPGADKYLPLEDTPQLYLAFATLGEKVWANPELSVSELAELALEFTREYGSLQGGVPLTLNDIIEDAKTVAWMVKSYIAVGGTAEACEAGELFWQRAIAKYGDGIAQHRERDFPIGSVESKRYIGVIVGSITNQHLKTHTVWQQVKVVFGDLAQPPLPPGFEPTYEASSLQGCIWVQFASLLMRESVLRRCEYDKCHKIFEAPSPKSRHEYCPTLDLEKDGCQVKAKNQRRYARRRANQLQASIQKDGE
ncbi:hypothetical protein FIL92_00900 [SAR202 cluster bacterium AD-812-D07_MRT_10900m]|jgi:hypothetical protein|nr:hypothetical protein [SAR202 cluster bacterium AD-812-D07_MRT_10900m]